MKLSVVYLVVECVWMMDMSDDVMYVSVVEWCCVCMMCYVL